MAHPDWPELANVRFEPVTEGMSGALLFRLTEDGHPLRYLKIARDESMASLNEEIARTRWLASQGVRVPVIQRIENGADQIAMLTEAVPGFPAQDSAFAPDQLVESLARGLGALHRLPAGDCPFDESLSVRLSRAAKAVASGEIDKEDFEPRNRRITPEKLLARVKQGRPAEDIVVVHGDATLTNLIVDGNGGLGFVDCGNAGRGDRYLDLAVTHAGIEEHFGKDASQYFLRAYRVRHWNSAKALYFSDLYELF